MYRIEHHLLNMHVIAEFLLQLCKHQYLKRSIYFCVKLLLTCLPFVTVNANFTLHQYFKSLNNLLSKNKVEISPLGTVFECHRFYSLHFLKVAAAAAVLHASTCSGTTFSYE